MPRLRDIANKFISGPVAEMEQAIARRDELDKQIAEQENLIGELSMAAVKAGMAETEVEAYRGSNAKLTELIGLRSACEKWIAELEQQERERQNEARIKANKSRAHAFTQQVRAYQRLLETFAKNFAAVVDDHKELHKQGDKIRQLLNPIDQYSNPAFHQFMSFGTAQIMAREMCRQSVFNQGDTNYNGVPNFPGVDSLRGTALGSFGLEDLVQDMRGIAVEAKEQGDYAIREFAKSLGLGTSDQADPQCPIPIARPLASPDAPKQTTLIEGFDLVEVEVQPDVLNIGGEMVPVAGPSRRKEWRMQSTGLKARPLTEPLGSPSNPNVQPHKQLSQPGINPHPTFAPGSAGDIEDRMMRGEPLPFAPRKRPTPAELDANADRTLAAAIEATRNLPSVGSAEQQLPRSEGFVYANGQSQVPVDRPSVSEAELDANAERTLASITCTVDDRYKAAAEATLAAVQSGPRNPHPVGSEAHAEYEQVPAQMHNPVAAAFEAAEALIKQPQTNESEGE